MATAMGFFHEQAGFYLLAEQLAEIIFTLFTVKVVPAAPEAPAPLLAADEEPAPEAELSELLPITRT